MLLPKDIKSIVVIAVSDTEIPFTITDLPVEYIPIWRQMAINASQAVKEVVEKLTNDNVNIQKALLEHHALVISPTKNGWSCETPLSQNYVIYVAENSITVSECCDEPVVNIQIPYSTLDKLTDLNAATLYKRGVIDDYTYFQFKDTVFVLELGWSLDKNSPFNQSIRQDDLIFSSDIERYVVEALRDTDVKEVEMVLKEYAKYAARESLVGLNSVATAEYEFLQEVLKELVY